MSLNFIFDFSANLIGMSIAKVFTFKKLLNLNEVSIKKKTYRDENIQS